MQNILILSLFGRGWHYSSFFDGSLIWIFLHFRLVRKMRALIVYVCVTLFNVLERWRENWIVYEAFHWKNWELLFSLLKKKIICILFLTLGTGLSNWVSFQKAQNFFYKKIIYSSLFLNKLSLFDFNKTTHTKSDIF